jgi:hypothetical protein
MKIPSPSVDMRVSFPYIELMASTSLCRSSFMLAVRSGRILREQRRGAWLLAVKVNYNFGSVTLARFGSGATSTYFQRTSSF